MKYWLTLGGFLFISTITSAQNLLGISTSRYGGTNRLYINPSLAADSPSKLYLNVATANLTANNNYFRYQAPFSLLKFITGNVSNEYKNQDGSVHFDVNYTRESLDGSSKNGTLAGEVRGPAILIKTGEFSAIAVTTRFRAVGQVVGASESLLSALRAGLGDKALYSIPTDNNKFSLNSNTYAELGLTYAGTLWQEEGQKLLLGLTGKILIGYNAQHIINRGANYRIVADPTNPNNAVLELNQLDATLGYTTFLENRSITPRTLFSTDSPGRGFGFDIGMTYVNQYDAESPALRLGVAVTDVGGLTYKGEQFNYADIGQNPVRFTNNDFNRITGSLDVLQSIRDKINVGRSPDKTSFRAGLPTSLNLTFDYQLPTGFGVNVTYFQDVRAVQALAVHQPSMLAVVPRYDARWLSLSLPIAYLNHGVTAGASVRVGPGWLGTDNLLGLLGNSANGIHPRGLDIYAGVAFGIGKVDED
ncbi:DUF5723 family protein [Spirosoma endophyticum]|uniref:DUF5723 domain-containing protein n=1 Tax=Spirosoma endophyticum TaxID=662367 RepID=A0A1I1MDC9_9BACT|nr:DUF5723 family protein [Spirosoma endophyticum]SFC80663.1 hypothetical protein SAMN05216167_102463 [Spirosoma endophyticum]